MGLFLSECEGRDPTLGWVARRQGRVATFAKDESSVGRWDRGPDVNDNRHCGV
jgi:hypothetical protein